MGDIHLQVEKTKISKKSCLHKPIQTTVTWFLSADSIGSSSYRHWLPPQTSLGEAHARGSSYRVLVFSSYQATLWYLGSSPISLIPPSKGPVEKEVLMHHSLVNKIVLKIKDCIEETGPRI